MRTPLTAEEQQRRAVALAAAISPRSAKANGHNQDDIKVSAQNFVLPPHLAQKVTVYADAVRVAAPSERLTAFKLCARQVFGLGETDQYPLHEKVDRLWASAEAHGLVERFGSDAVQRALAEASADPIVVDEFTPPLLSSNNAGIERNDAEDAASIASDQEIEAEIARLIALTPLQYERERSGTAARLGLRTSVLDGWVKSARPQDANGQGRAFELPSVEPWPDPVKGEELLDQISAAIGSYVVMPEESAGALALWVIHTHCFDCFSHSPRTAITSPEKGCGKTLTLDVLSCLVARPLPTANATAAAIFRIVEMSSPTLLIDEADTFLNENQELRGILNSGHRRGGTVLRTVGDEHEPRQFSTWAPAAIAMIGRLPDTLNDRSIVINLRRRNPAERVQSFRSDRVENLTVLARKMARWALDHRGKLAVAEPDMGKLQNRTADNWRPLLAVADLAGGRWPEEARKIATALAQAAIDQSISAQLFADIRWIFDGCPGAEGTTTATDRLASAVLVDRLVKIEGRPWAEWKGGKPITQNTLARHLGRFGIVSQTVRFSSGHTAKGYYRSDFDDAFERYAPSQNVTTSQPNNHGHCDALQSVTAEKPVTLSETSQRNNHGHCDAVTLSTPRREAIEL
jgi:hypothetical protein